jgi:signal transduction histidine kinase
MVGRIVAVATLMAGCVLAAGVGMAHARLAGLHAAFDARAALARTLVTPEAQPRELATALASDDLRIAVADRANGVVYEAYDGIGTQRPIPPLPPGAPPPPMPRPNAPLERLAGLLAGREPARIDPPFGISVIIAPNLPRLARFLAADLIATCVLLLLIGAAAVWIVRGIHRSERAQLERMLEERRAVAKEYQRFLADAGHELRTPLTIVSGYVEILDKEIPENATTRQILTGLRAETARMRALVEKLLMLARLESAVSIPRLLDVAEIANDVVTQMRARYPGRELHLHSQSATIVADEDDVYEALRNLVENALRYAPRSAVEIDVAPAPSGTAITVTDRGDGIPPEEHKQIFQRFYRGRSHTDNEGSGLGLAIVARVAERWHGAIALESLPGRTSFALHFPLAEEEPA